MVLAGPHEGYFELGFPVSAPPDVVFRHVKKARNTLEGVIFIYIFSFTAAVKKKKIN